MLKRNQEQRSEAANFFVTLLLRYPIINRISFDGNKQLISFMFLVQDNLAKEKQLGFVNKWADAFQTLHFVENIKPKKVSFDSQGHDNVTIFHLQRDLDTLSYSELSLTARIMWQMFADRLVIDDVKNTGFHNQMHEQLLARMLIIAKQQTIFNDLHVFRDEGKVVISDL